MLVAAQDAVSWLTQTLPASCKTYDIGARPQFAKIVCLSIVQQDMGMHLAWCM